MIELYLVVTALSGSPKIDVYQDMAKACDSVANSTQQIYKETIKRNGDVTLVEGSCKAVVSFSAK